MLQLQYKIYQYLYVEEETMVYDDGLCTGKTVA